jgi:hypothetical protein
MKARFHSEEAFFLVHVENQATAQADFPKRMFQYFARLTAKYDLPIYPVVIFSYDMPKRPEPNSFVVAFPHKTVLRFEYTVIQLNRLPWRRFTKEVNTSSAETTTRLKRLSPQQLDDLGEALLDFSSSADMEQ